MEKQIEQLEIKYPEKARGMAKFDVSMAPMIIAGADFMLIPSIFEPCGLIQLHAMRYGTVSSRSRSVIKPRYELMTKSKPFNFSKSL